MPCQEETVFQDLDIGFLSVDTLQALQDTEASFSRLERKAYDVIKDVLERTVWGEDWNARKSAQYKDGKANPVSLHVRDAETLRKYLLFLRFRNSEGYQQIVDSLRQSYQSDPEESDVFSAYRPLIVQLRLRHVLQDFASFLDHTTIGKHFVRRHAEAPIHQENPTLKIVHYEVRVTQKLCAIMHYYALFLRLYIIEQINQIIQNKPNKTYAQICLDKLCTFLHYWAILCVKKP